MNDIDQLLNELSVAARSEPPPQIDVRARVLATLSVRNSLASNDIVPIAFAGAALAVAASALIVVMPIWQTLTDPWAAYIP